MAARVEEVSRPERGATQREPKLLADIQGLQLYPGILEIVATAWRRSRRRARLNSGGTPELGRETGARV
jgi:hypothetical protein